MRFIVEVPTYLQVEVEAADAESAKLTAETAAGRLYGQFNDYPVEHKIMGLETRTRLLPLGADEDHAADVYLCREGELLESTGTGFAPTGERCQ